MIVSHLDTLKSLEAGMPIKIYPKYSKDLDDMALENAMGQIPMAAIAGKYAEWGQELKIFLMKKDRDGYEDNPQRSHPLEMETIWPTDRTILARIVFAAKQFAHWRAEPQKGKKRNVRDFVWDGLDFKCCYVYFVR